MPVKENLAEYHNCTVEEGKLSLRIKIENFQHNY